MERISIQIEVKATIEKIWDYWTNPEHIINWNFASDEWCCPSAVNNLQPNGKFRWRMEAKDGSVGFDFEGTYVKVIERELISYRMTDDRKVDVEFAPDGELVKITESFEPEGSNSDDQQRAGWQAILVNFKKYVESE